MGQYLNDLRKSRRIHGSLELCILTVNKFEFTVDAKNKTISCEASDLKDRRDLNLSRRIWLPDSRPEKGFIMQSRDTGNRVLFIESEIVKDNEGDIQCWKFVPYKDLEGWTFIVFND